MKRIILFICLVMFLTVPCFSQETEKEPEQPAPSEKPEQPVQPEQPAEPKTPAKPVQPEEPKNPAGPDGTVLFQPVRKGDKFMKIGFSLGVPLFNTSREKFAANPKMYPGGTIDVGFGYYVLNGFSLGGTLSFQFYLTRSKNIYFAVPISFDMAYTFAVSKWRFPLGIGIGGAFESYNGNGEKYFGMMVRPEVGAYYQHSPNWSFGGSLSWLVLPEWYKDTKNNRIGNFLNIAFAARYHF